jgi:hypothetical protein
MSRRSGLGKARVDGFSPALGSIPAARSRQQAWSTGPLAAGRSRPLIYDRLPLSEAARAHRLLATSEITLGNRP